MFTDVNPYRELNADISYADFEVFCMNTLKAYAEKEGLKDFEIKHNQKIEADDGIYQIDVYAEYTALGARNKVIIECKKYAESIERKIVAELYAKIQSLGAHKGIIISTSGFQSGATLYAQKHGIALWQIADSQIRHVYNSISMSERFMKKVAFDMMVDQLLPKYFVMEWDCKNDFPYEEIYPTEQMKNDAMKKAREILGV